MLAAEWGVTKNGRRARYYQLTPAGRAFLNAESERLVDHFDALVTILGAKKGLTMRFDLRPGVRRLFRLAPRTSVSSSTPTSTKSSRRSSRTASTSLVARGLTVDQARARSHAPTRRHPRRRTTPTPPIGTPTGATDAFARAVRDHRSGSSLRRARPRATSGLHRGRCPHARDRHRRDDGDLQRGERAASASAALRASRRVDERLARHAEPARARPSNDAMVLVVSEVPRLPGRAARLQRPRALFIVSVHLLGDRPRACARRVRRRALSPRARTRADARARLRARRRLDAGRRAADDPLVFTVETVASTPIPRIIGHTVVDRSGAVPRDRHRAAILQGPVRRRRSLRSDHRRGRSAISMDRSRTSSGWSRDAQPGVSVAQATTAVRRARRTRQRHVSRSILVRRPMGRDHATRSTTSVSRRR